MYKIFLVLLACAILSGCGKKENAEVKTLNGGIKGGGTYVANENDNVKSLDPVRVSNDISLHVSHQIYDLLVDLDSNLQLAPELATRWEISPDGLTYTFHLRNDVFFHDNACFPDGKGRKMTAADVKFSYDRICDPNSGTLGFDYYKNYVVGANEFFDNALELRRSNQKPSINGVSGFIAQDDSTFIIKLKKPFGPFIYYTTLAFAYIIPKEAVEKYGQDYFQNPVGTGAFTFVNWSPDYEINLKRNPNYWAKDQYGNQLPYVDNVKFKFIKEHSQQLIEFVNGNIDESYRIPNESFKDVVDENKQLKGQYTKFILQRQPAMAVQFYGFLVNSKNFSDKRIRQAFSYAIDRERIVKFVLNGQGIEAYNGIVPPSIKGYDAKNIKGYNFDLEKAKQLMTEAGYPGGKGFPEVTLQINEGGGRNTQVAEAIQNMLREIGVNMKIQPVQFSQHTENIDAGRAEYYRLGWIADYPDPENFLNLLYGKNVPVNPQDISPINSFRYKNPQYDEIFERAIATTDQNERYKLYQQAEQFAINDAPLMIIFYDEDYRLLQPYVRNFPLDPMHRPDMKIMWLDK